MTILHYETVHSTFCVIKEDVPCELSLGMHEAIDGPAILCCEIDGKDWEDCMAKYHEHMGWEPYVPMDVD